MAAKTFPEAPEQINSVLTLLCGPCLHLEDEAEDNYGACSYRRDHSVEAGERPRGAEKLSSFFVIILSTNQILLVYDSLKRGCCPDELTKNSLEPLENRLPY